MIININILIDNINNNNTNIKNSFIIYKNKIEIIDKLKIIIKSIKFYFIEKRKKKILLLI